jgi:hypothetical protein
VAFALVPPLVTTLLGLGLTGGVVHKAVAAVPSCNEDPDQSATVKGDLNGDGGADVVVGVPNASERGHQDVGEVHVFLSDGGRQRVSLETISGSGGEQGHARFGASVSTPDFDGDRCADLAVGSPGLDGVGGVYLLHGSRAGITSTGGVKVTAPDGEAGDGFGSTVATSDGPDGSTDLWVGAPGRAIDGQGQSGEVYHYTVSQTFVPELVGTISYATEGVPGEPVAGDRFGEIISATFGQLVVGVPQRAVAGRAAAGEVVFAAQPGTAVTAQVVNQDSPGVPGVAETADHFGAALDGGYVGIPGEDIGSAEDAGAVQVFTFNGTTFVPGASFSQDSPDVPDQAERGDHFGAALAGGTWYLCQEEGDLAVGAPGESVGAVKGAGSVTVVAVRSEGTPCPAMVYTQGTNLPGRARSGNHVGASLTTLSGNADDDEDYRSGLVVGSPGQDGTVTNAGAALTGLSTTAETLRAVGGERQGQSFGSVLAHTLG